MADSEFDQLVKIGSQRNPSQQSRYEQLKSQGAASAFEGGSSGGFQMPDFTGFFKEQESARQRQSAEQAAKEAEFLTRYTTAMKGQPSVGALAERIGGELGVPAIRQNALSLQQLLAKMPYTQRQATQGFDVTQNQLDRIIAQKTGELAPVVSDVTRAEQSAQQALAERLGYEVSAQQKELKPFEIEGGMLSERIARETTGFSQSQTNELNALLAKMQAGIQMSQFEINRADQLAQNERNYELEKSKIAASQQPESKYVEVGKGSALFNPATGTWTTPPGYTGAGTGSSAVSQYLTPKGGAASNYLNFQSQLNSIFGR